MKFQQNTMEIMSDRLEEKVSNLSFNFKKYIILNLLFNFFLVLSTILFV
jgi:hypothetical protein